VKSNISQVMRVSIHASRGGRDTNPSSPASKIGLFQSTRPVGDATADPPKKEISAVKFQSTRPVGDATEVFGEQATEDGGFNPRVPWGTRRRLRALGPHHGAVSIHASRGGRDSISSWLNPFFEVSIHASRGGRDGAKP